MRVGAAESILVIEALNELRLESLPPHPLSIVRKSPLPPLLVGLLGGLKVLGLLLASTSESSAMFALWDVRFTCWSSAAVADTAEVEPSMMCFHFLYASLEMTQLGRLLGGVKTIKCFQCV